MSPMVILVCGFNILVSGSWLFLRGISWKDMGPAVLMIAGSGWYLWTDWLRYRVYVRHRNSGFVPGTQNLAIWGIVGCFACSFSSMVWALFLVHN